MNRIKKVRLWLAYKLIGNTPLINNVTFYQTICLDADTKIMINSVDIHQNHTIKWKGKEDGIGINFDRYKDSINNKGG